MISGEDDIKFVMKDNSEYELRCFICNFKLKYPTSWHRHKMTIKHMNMEVMKTYMLINLENNGYKNHNNSNDRKSSNDKAFKITESV